MSCTVIAADRRFCFPTKIVLSVYFKIGNFKPITVFRCCTDWLLYRLLYLGLPRRQVFSIQRLKYCSEDCKKLACIALVRSILEYGAVVWDPYQGRDIIAVEKVQRQAARFIKMLINQDLKDA